MGNQWATRFRWQVRCVLIVFVGFLVYSMIAFAGPPSSTARDASPIVVTLDAQHLRAFQSYFFGANSGHLRNAFNWDDAGFQQSLGKLQFLKTLRFPAGELANYWDWKSGTIMPNSNDTPDTERKLNAYPAPLSELKTEDSVSHAEALFVLNMLTNPQCPQCALTTASPNLAYQMEMLSAAHRMGISLNYLELGNEYYIDKKDYEAVYPDPVGKSDPIAAALYGRLATQWIQAIKKKYPDVKIAVVGAAPINSKATVRKNEWLPGLFDPSYNSVSVGGDGRPSLKGADAVTLHVYPGPDMPPGTVIDEKATEELLAKAYKQWNEIKLNDLPLIPANMPVWFTEYNLHNSKNVPFMGTWAHGLFVATFSLLLMEDQRVQMETHHELVGNAGYGDLFYSTDAFAHVDGGGSSQGPTPSTKLWGASAMAGTMNMLGLASASADQAERLVFQGAPALVDAQGNATYPALYGWSFLRGADHRAVILNLCHLPLTVDVRGIMPHDVYVHSFYKQISGDPGTYVTGGLDASPTKLTQVQGSMAGRSVLLLPPFSITVILPS
jgi:hypothetical protein